jgi:tripartite motif-containing protein 71
MPIARATLLAVALAAAPASAAPPDPPAFKAPRFVLAWGKKGTAEGEFHVPIGIAVGKGDRVLVTDLRNQRVQQFDPDGKFLSAFAVAGQPSGIAVAPDGTVYVALFDKDRIAAHTPEGKPLREWGQTGRGDGEFRSPAGLAVGPDGSVYLGDDVNRRVQKFSPAGKFLAKWGKGGDGPGEFGGPGTEKLHPDFRTSGPNFLAFDAGGLLYATEGRGGKVHRFKADGAFVSAWGDNDDKPGGFGGRPKDLPGPTGIAVDQGGRVWVAASNSRVQQFTAEGKYLGGFGKRGAGEGEFHTPHGLAVDRKGNLYVADTQNNRIQKFAP